MPRVPGVVAQPSAAPLFQGPGAVVPQGPGGQEVQQLGRNLAGLGHSAITVGLEAESQILAGRLKQNLSRAQNAVSNALETPETGFLNLVGKDAVDGYEPAQQAVSQALEDVAASIQDDDEARQFAAQRDALQFRAQRQMANHYSRESVAFNIGETAGAMATAADSYVGAVTNGDLEGAAEQHFAFVDAVDELADLQSLGPNQRKQAKRKAMTSLHASVVESMVGEGRTHDARTYLAQNREEVAKDVGSRLTALVRRSSVADDSTRISLQLLKPPEPADLDTSEIEGDPMSEQYRVDEAEAIRMREQRRDLQVQEAYDKLDEMFERGNISAEVRDATRARIRSNEAQRRQDIAQYRESVMTDAERWLVDNPLKSVQELPEHLYTQLRVHGLLGGIAGFADGRRYTTDPEAFALLETIPDNALTGKSWAEWWVELRPRLNNADLNYMRARYAQATKSMTPELRRVVSIEDRVRRTAKELGILPKNAKASPSKLSEYDEFQFQFNQELELWQKVHGREATDDDIQQLLDLKVLDVVREPGTFFDTAGPLITFDADNAELEVPVPGRDDPVKLREIPTDTYQQIGLFLEAKGVPPTAANIAEYWVAIGGGR